MPCLTYLGSYPSSWPYAQDVIDVALPDKRQDRLLGKEESVHEQISIRRSHPCPHHRTLNLLVDLTVEAEDVAPKDYVEKFLGICEAS